MSKLVSKLVSTPSQDVEPEASRTSSLSERVDVTNPIVVTAIACILALVLTAIGALVPHGWPIPMTLGLLIAVCATLLVSWQRPIALACALAIIVAAIIGAPFVAPIVVLVVVAVRRFVR